MIVDALKTRFYPNGKLKTLIKQVELLTQKNPNSELAKSILIRLKKKFWFGAKSVTYDSLTSILWNTLTCNQQSEIFDLRGLRLKNEHALLVEYSDIFLADENTDLSDLKEERYIAAKILAYMAHEGPYQRKNVILREGDIVIDAGANIGLFSLYALSKASKIYAFEPQLRAQDILCENISLNKGDKIINVIPLGLSDQNKDYNLIYDPTMGHVAASIVRPESDLFSKEVITCVTLDNWVKTNNISRVDFIKADIEGAERYMLLGAKNVLKTFAPRLAICTYHYPEDPVLLEKIILEANPNYIIEHTSHKLFAYVN